ncbi:GNAT family N-acetyltransferase [Rhodobacteraceae bacterium S2214]|nr:GNAT family N-acetyltransferase [Rhodobacteraceae bacterium S2214]
MIRPLQTYDASRAVLIFYDAIMNGAADAYNLDQRRAWAGPVPDIDGWQNRFDGVSGFVAEHGNQMLGFMTIDDAGYIDLAFVHSDHIGTGVGSQLYAAVEEWAVARQIPRLTSDASIKAEPFFMRQDWVINAKQDVTKNGVTLSNFRMSKVLAPLMRPDQPARSL